MSSSGSRILAVDDDIDLLKLLSVRLKTAGYEVTTAANGDEALAALATVRPQIIITDVRMEGMDGMALFEEVRKQHPALPVIMLTAHGTIPDAVAATQQGVFGYLTKPVDPKALLEEVERALAVSALTSTPTPEAWRREIVTCSALMEDVLAKTRLVAATDASVLITGESGSGKELLARAIHNASSRAEGSFIAINCGAIPEQLLESELFGYIKGAFTGAVRDSKGLLVAAHGGTLFFDEIGDMAQALQVKLLRVLQERQVRPLGTTQTQEIDVRVISATHRDLEAEMKAGKFREDLYYRLNVVGLTLPRLVDRREDIPLLALHFLTRLSAQYQKDITGFAPEALELLVAAPWPGNVRQLYNVVEQAVALATTTLVSSTMVEQALQDAQRAIDSFEDARKRFERDYLVQLLKITAGNVTLAAKLAKRNRTEFYKLLGRHALDPSHFKHAKPAAD